MQEFIHQYGAITGWSVLLLFIVVTFGNQVKFVDQATVLVITKFGKFERIMRAGLNFKVPFIEAIESEISLQHFSWTQEFSAITSDQANVHFKTMMVWGVADGEDETIKTFAFKFSDSKSRGTAMNKTIEGIVRSLVATKKQAEILGIRKEITEYVKACVDATLLEWGCHMVDLQINDITFDKQITESMTQVVASLNKRAAAENEGEALRITLTKKAEAEGAAIVIAAKAECEAATQRGKGIASFREEVAKGTVEAANDLKAVGLDATMINFGTWTDMLRHVAEVGKGNVIFFDGSPDGMQRAIKQSMAMQLTEKTKT